MKIEKIKLFVLGMLSLNGALVLAVLCGLLRWFPSQIKFSLSGDGGMIPIQLVSKDGTVITSEWLEASPEGAPSRIYVPAEFSFNEIGLRIKKLDGQKFTASVKNVRFEKYKVLEIFGRADNIELTDEATFPFGFSLSSRFRLSSVNAMCILGGVELLFVLMSLLKRRRFEMHKGEVIKALVVAFGLAALFALVVPVQNRALIQPEVNLELLSFGRMIIFDFVVKFVFIFLIFLALHFLFGPVLFALSVALLGCCYLECTLLSIGSPEFNGDMSFYNFGMRSIIDLSLWVAIVLFAVLLQSFISKNVVMFVSSIAVLSVASLFDMKRPSDAKSIGASIRSFATIERIAQSVTFSPRNNILVFVLDSIGTEEAVSAMKNAGLSDQFDGFVAYTNNVGMHGSTYPATAALLTGNYFEDPCSFQKYYSSIFSTESVLDSVLRVGFDAYLMPGSFSFGYSNKVRNISGGAEKLEPGEVSCMTKRMMGSQMWNLREVCWFRALPHFAKRFFYRIVASGWCVGQDSQNEEIMYGILKTCGVKKEASGSFLYVHTNGTHIPILLDKTGRKLASPNNTFAGAVALSEYCFTMLGRLFEHLQEIGVYDKSIIIVTADHGGYFHGPPPYAKDEMPQRALPFLWVKPVGAHGEFTTSSLPTSHVGVSCVIRESAQVVLSKDAVERLLSKGKRMFRFENNGIRQDWTMDSNGMVSYDEGPFAVKGDSHEPIVINKRYSLRSSEVTSDKMPVEFRNVSMLTLAPRFKIETPKMVLQFRVPDVCKSYNVILGVEMDAGYFSGKMSFWDDKESLCLGTLEADRQAELKLRNLKPDPQTGIISIVGSHDDLSCGVYFNWIEINEK